MSTFDDVVNDCLQLLQGFGLGQSRAGFLASPVLATDLQFSLTDAAGFEQGVAEIENELVFIESVDYSSGIVTISPDGRGWYGTAPAAHAANTRITMAPTWPKKRVADAINEAITGTYPALFGVGVTSFNYNGSATTYSMPADAEKVLKVTADTLGPSQDQVQINRFSFNSGAPVSEFATGNSITLEQGPAPGRLVTVAYMKQPVELDYGQQFTDSGLSETAKLAVKYAACSALAGFLDVSRLPVDTAQADAYDPSKNGVGTAQRVSNGLYQRYLVELETERKRLRAAYPTQITMRTR